MRERHVKPIAELANTSSAWSGWGDSNSRPPAPKAGALTKLRYTPSVGQQPIAAPSAVSSTTTSYRAIGPPTGGGAGQVREPIVRPAAS